jgi:hypothetical protein
MHDTIRFLKRKMAEKGIDKPIWGREIGVGNDFLLMPQTESEMAARVLKKFASSFAEGVKVCTVTPFIAFAGFEEYAFSGLYDNDVQMYRLFYPSAPISELQEKFGKPMLRSCKLLSQYLSGCTLDHYVLNGEAGIYIFRDKIHEKKVIIGWTDNIDDQLIPSDYFSPEMYEGMSLYDYLGTLQGPIVPSTLTEEPFVLVLAGSALLADAGKDVVAFVGDEVTLGQNSQSSVGDDVILSQDDRPGVGGEVILSKNNQPSSFIKANRSLKFIWTQISGPPVQLDGQNSPNPTFVGNTVAAYEFQLVVTDGRETSPPDSVLVIVKRKVPLIGCTTYAEAGGSLGNGIANVLIWLTPAMISLFRRSSKITKTR